MLVRHLLFLSRTATPSARCAQPPNRAISGWRKAAGGLSLLAFVGCTSSSDPGTPGGHAGGGGESGRGGTGAAGGLGGSTPDAGASGGVAGQAGGGGATGGQAGQAGGPSTGGRGGAGGGGIAGSGGGGAGGSGGSFPVVPGEGCDPSAAPGTGDLGTITVQGVARWKNDARAAYSMIHDDTCDYSTSGLDTAWVEGKNRGLRVGWGVITRMCKEREQWDTGVGQPAWAFLVKPMVEAGMEIVNHTKNHTPCASEVWDPEHKFVPAKDYDFATEFGTSSTEIKDNAGIEPTFFVFPLDAFSDDAFAYLKKLGYVGARGGDRTALGYVNGPDIDVNDPYADFRTTFDAYPPAGQDGKLQKDFSGYDDKLDDPVGLLQAHVDAAVSKGGWSVREFHGVSDTSWGTVKLEVYKAHLDHLVERVSKGDLFVDTPSRVVRYRRSRTHCTAPTAANGALSFAPQNADCQRYAIPISVIVTTTQDAPTLYAEQDGACIATRKLATGKYVVNANPTGGPVKLSPGKQ